MKKLILLLSLLSIVCLPTYSIDKEIVEDYYDIAKDYYQKGQYNSALEYTNQILKICPEHYGAQCIYIKLTPPTSWLNNTNLTTQIVPTPEKITTGYPVSDKFNLDGQKFYNEKDYENAKLCFWKAIKANPRNRYAFNNLGLCFSQNKEYWKAERCFRKANALNISFSVPLDNLGLLFINNEEYKKADESLNQAILRNKNDFCAYYLLGLSYKLQHRYSDATKKFNEVIQISPDFSLAYLQLADTYYLSKDYNWSNISIEKYLKLNPNDDFGYYLLSRNYKVLEDYNIAKSYIIKAIHINNCIDYRIELANIEDLMGNTNEAIKCLEIINEPNGEILNQIGLYYAKNKSYKQAIEYFKKASAAKKSRPIYLYNEALMYKYISDLENFNKTMDTIESMQPITAQDYVDLSAIYLNYTGKNQALEILDNGIKISPKSKILYEAKSKIYEITNDSKALQKNKEKISRIFKDAS